MERLLGVPEGSRGKRCPGSGPLPVFRALAYHPIPAWRPKRSSLWPPVPPPLHQSVPRPAPEPHRSMLNPKRKTNMVAFFCVLRRATFRPRSRGFGRFSATRPAGLGSADRWPRAWAEAGEFLVCESGQYGFDDLFTQDHIPAQDPQLFGPTFITPLPPAPYNLSCTINI